MMFVRHSRSGDDLNIYVFVAEKKTYKLQNVNNCDLDSLYFTS